MHSVHIKILVALSLLEESLIEESEDDIKNGNVTTHNDFKHEVQAWRNMKKTGQHPLKNK